MPDGRRAMSWLVAAAGIGVMLGAITVTLAVTSHLWIWYCATGLVAGVPIFALMFAWVWPAFARWIERKVDAQFSESTVDAPHVEVTSVRAEREVPSPKIVEATYGVDDQSVDVAPVLRDLIARTGVIDLVVSNEVLGSDPVPGRLKELRIRYEFGGQLWIESFVEGSRFCVPREGHP